MIWGLESYKAAIGVSSACKTPQSTWSIWPRKGKEFYSGYILSFLLSYRKVTFKDVQNRKQSLNLQQVNYGTAKTIVRFVSWSQVHPSGLTSSNLATSARATWGSTRIGSSLCIGNASLLQRLTVEKVEGTEAQLPCLHMDFPLFLQPFPPCVQFMIMTRADVIFLPRETKAEHSDYSFAKTLQKLYFN